MKGKNCMKSVKFLLPLLLLCAVLFCGCTGKEEKKIDEVVKRELDLLISLAVKRLSGHDRAYLVVCGLGEFARMTKKSIRTHSSDVATIEGFISRYEKAVPNLEILFI